MSFKKVDRLWTAINRGTLNPARAASVFDVLMAENAARQRALDARRPA